MKIHESVAVSRDVKFSEFRNPALAQLTKTNVNQAKKGWFKLKTTFRTEAPLCINSRALIVWASTIRYLSTPSTFPNA